MRRLSILFVLGLLILLVLVATGFAGPSSPTLTISCPVDANGTGCVANSVVTFSGANLNPHKTYAIQGSAPEDPADSFFDVLAVNSDGTYSDSPGFLPAGTWTFTLSVLDHTDNPQKDLVTDTVLFD